MRTAPSSSLEAVKDQLRAGPSQDPISMGQETSQTQARVVFRQSRESMSARNGDQSLTNPLFRAPATQLRPGRNGIPHRWGRKILRRGPEYPAVMAYQGKGG